MMGKISKLLQSFTEKREEQTVEADGVFSYFGNYEKITKEKSLNIPSVSASLEFISSAIAGLPIVLYKDNNGETQAIDDERVYCLNSNTGDTLDCFQIKKQMIIDYLLIGKAFIYINKDKGKVKSLHYVDCNSVSSFKNQDAIFKTGYYLINGKRYNDFQFIKMLRNTKDGITGTGILQECNDILVTAYNELKFEQALLKNSGMKKGIITLSDKVSPDNFDEVKKSGRQLLESDDAIIFMNAGTDFKQLNSTAVENQLNENKALNKEEICKLFGLSSNIITGQATDEQYANAIKTAVIPIVTAFETALNSSLLLENEKSNYYFAFDTRQLLKGDILKRYQAYQIGLNSNFLQPDEVRYFEDLAPLGLDFIKLGLNDVLYNVKTKEIYTPNTNKTKSIDNTNDSAIDNYAERGDKYDEN